MDKIEQAPKKDLVFIIDDNDMYSMMVEYVLSESDCYRFEKYSSGEECLANLNHNPDAIVLDYYLPGMNGLNILRQIRRRLPNVPVIMLSKNMSKVEIKQLFKEGATEYIYKAKDSIRQLKSALHKLLKQKDQKVRSNKATALIILFWVIISLLFFVILYKNIKFI